MHSNKSRKIYIIVFLSVLKKKHQNGSIEVTVVTSTGIISKYEQKYFLLKNKKNRLDLEKSVMAIDEIEGDIIARCSQYKNGYFGRGISKGVILLLRLNFNKFFFSRHNTGLL